MNVSHTMFANQRSGAADEVEVDVHVQDSGATVLTVKLTDKGERFMWHSAEVVIFDLSPLQMIQIGEQIERRGRELAGVMEVQRMDRLLSNGETAAFIGEPLPAA